MNDQPAPLDPCAGELDAARLPELCRVYPRVGPMFTARVLRTRGESPDREYLVRYAALTGFPAECWLPSTQVWLLDDTHDPPEIRPEEAKRMIQRPAPPVQPWSDFVALRARLLGSDGAP